MDPHSGPRGSGSGSDSGSPSEPDDTVAAPDGTALTTRERIADRLRQSPAAGGTLATEFGIRATDALSHVRHIARSLEPTDEQLLVAPPECHDCGFTDFHDLVNRPSRCPECKSEDVEEPAFTIERE